MCHMPQSNQPFDSLLFLSFGGPEGHDDVRPFLENVTRGRGIPPERLDEVEQHYHRFGGKSPLNDLNREIIRNVEQELHERGIDIPVYFGNRNWKPFAEEATQQAYADGKRNVAVFATSAWAGYSGCRQYHEDIARSLASLDAVGTGTAATGTEVTTEATATEAPATNNPADAPMTLTKLRQFFDHPRFIAAMVDSCREAFAEIPEGLRDQARLVFTAHSIPIAADESAGMPEDGPLYSTQVKAASAQVAEALGIADFDVVWQSRSGAPHIPWLEPDVVDHIAAIHEQGVPAAVVCPIGFVSDHIEVVWDLDNELAAEAEQLGMPIARAKTAGPSREFAKMVVDLLLEAQSGAPEAHLSSTTSRGRGVNGTPCATSDCGSCCQSMRRPHSAKA